MFLLRMASSGCNAYLQEEEDKEEERNKCLLGVGSGLVDRTFCRVGNNWWNGFKMIAFLYFSGFLISSEY